MSILLIFIDGIGIGTRGARNPLHGLDGNLLAVFRGEDPALPYDGKMASTEKAVDPGRQTVIITSDHGNIEDLTTRSHTMNPVATMAFGCAADAIISRVRSLTDIVPAIMAALAPA